MSPIPCKPRDLRPELTDALELLLIAHNEYGPALRQKIIKFACDKLERAQAMEGSEAA